MWELFLDFQNSAFFSFFFILSSRNIYSILLSTIIKCCLVISFCLVWLLSLPSFVLFSFYRCFMAWHFSFGSFDGTHLDAEVPFLLINETSQSGKRVTYNSLKMIFIGNNMKVFSFFDHSRRWCFIFNARICFLLFISLHIWSVFTIIKLVLLLMFLA